jgi:ABC-type phosphate transport system substrate-binding protein
MRMFSIRWSRLISLILLLGAAGAAQAGTAIIAHPGNPLAGITQEQLARIYLGKTREFPNGAPVTALDLREGNPTRTKFYKTVTDKSEAALKAYWSKLLFTGKAQPPKEMSDDEAVRDWVSKNPDALGYVDGKVLDKSVKVLLILP